MIRAESSEAMPVGSKWNDLIIKLYERIIYSMKINKECWSWKTEIRNQKQATTVGS